MILTSCATASSSHTQQWDYEWCSLASHTLCRERVWSCCNYWVVAEECNYPPLWLGNKMLTSTKPDVLYSMIMDVICEEHGSDWPHQVSVVATSWWLQPSPLCKGCGLRDYEWCGRPPPPPHTHTCTQAYMLMWLFKINHMISLVPRLMPAYATSLGTRLSYDICTKL